MTLVREKRHRQALTLSLPPPISIWTPRLSLDVGSFSGLEKLAVLGHGTGGTVYKVRHRQTSCIYALKVLRFGEDAAARRQQAAREAEILKRVDSQFVVKCHGVVDSNGRGDLCFVMEYMDGGSLQDVLLTRRRLSEKVISGVARRVLEGLRYLHGMQIVHRDIKPSNLLINNEGETKIADFGASRVGVDDKVGACHDIDSYMGTSAYMSPERFDPERWNGNGDGDCCDGFAGDVWSLGVVVLECHVGRFPLIGPGQKPDWPTLMCAICFGERMEMPETVSPEFRSFAWRCLEKDWRKRGTVTELLSHPFVTLMSNNTSTQELLGYALEA